jgi:hypothetical protein
MQEGNLLNCSVPAVSKLEKCELWDARKCNIGCPYISSMHWRPYDGHVSGVHGKNKCIR